MAWVERTWPHMVELAQHQRRFRELTAIVERNKRLQEIGGPFIDWIFLSHAQACAMAIRRQAKGQGGDDSLENFLNELQVRSTLVTRAWYVGKWAPRGIEETAYAHDSFDSFGLVRRATVRHDDDHLDPVGVAADLAALDKATKAIVKHASVRIAHLQRDARVHTTWGDLRAGVEGLFVVFAKYYRLLTLNVPVQIEPVEQYDALEVFTFPWIAPPAVSAAESSADVTTRRQ